jgi:anthranilate 1,2-dioxygenase large subunit/terephthalate 1,2-dioxygenase oxygenase component alpha subunit
MIGGFVQRGIPGSPEAQGIYEMGGDATCTQDTRATEASIRGLWKAYRRYMGI